MGQRQGLIHSAAFRPRPLVRGRDMPLSVSILSKPRAKARGVKGLIFVISGPSGSGKTTLAEKSQRLNALKGRVVKGISFTTRPKRPGEKEARDYFFISQEAFRERLKAKKILEWTRYLGYYYGTPGEFVEGHLKKGSAVVLCLDLKGALKIKGLYPKNTVTIFVLPPTVGALRKRIEGRCFKTGRQEICRRLNLAKKEIAASRKYDYRIVNRDLGRAVERLKGIILKEMRD